MDLFFRTICVFLFFTIVFPEEIKYHQSPYKDSFQYKHAGKIGDNPFPTNPMSDRAIGYLLQGKHKLQYAIMGTLSTGMRIPWASGMGILICHQ